MATMQLEVLKGVKGIEGKKVYISNTKEKGVLKFQAGMASRALKKQVTNIEWEYKEGRSVGKTAVGAIGGGLIAGPIGLVAGAAIGAKKNEISTAVITLEEGDQLLVRISGKDYELLSSWL